jgi:hypothetical protein
MGWGKGRQQQEGVSCGRGFGGGLGLWRRVWRPLRRILDLFWISNLGLRNNWPGL